MDVARGHLDALAFVDRTVAERVAAGEAADKVGLLDVFNFGTGQGTTVFELIKAMEDASGKKVPFTVGPRRAGDLDAAYADPSKAARVLGWAPRFSIVDSCRDAWKWQSENPQGFAASGK